MAARTWCCCCMRIRCSCSSSRCWKAAKTWKKGRKKNWTRRSGKFVQKACRQVSRPRGTDSPDRNGIWQESSKPAGYSGGEALRSNENAELKEDVRFHKKEHAIFAKQTTLSHGFYRVDRVFANHCIDFFDKPFFSLFFRPIPQHSGSHLYP